MAATTPGMTAREALHREPTAMECPVVFHGLHGVLRAAGFKAADSAAGQCGEQRRDGPAVKPQESKQDVLKEIQVNQSVSHHASQPKNLFPLRRIRGRPVTSAQS